ncbi:hypothetical protein [Enterococcus rotai]|uniref:hypothetical protein n=1 Tax=Enterococcus rotai TaxID=118060 RepID=UPI0032B5B14E
MKTKKIALLTLFTLLLAIPLTACGSNENKYAKSSDTESKDIKSSDTDSKNTISKNESDPAEDPNIEVVSKRTEKINGKEETIVTLRDGTEVVLPEGVNVDDLQIKGEN